MDATYSSFSDPLLIFKTKNENEEENNQGGVVVLSSSSMLFRDVWKEIRLIWYIAGPAILTSLFQYSIAFVTQTLVGHIGTTELAAFGIQNLVIAGIGFGVMLGMGSALETLCGQAYGAGKVDMLGIYMQRSWVILISTGFLLSIVYMFATPILRMLGQSEDIAVLAGKLSIWLIPQLFAYAFNFPIQKFLQAQSKVMAMTWISLGSLVLHVLLSWLCIIKLDMGLVGAALTLNLSWWGLVLSQLLYVLFSESCKEAWTGFSWLAFADLAGFVWLSLASAVMLCLEYWYFMVLILFAGLLKDPELTVGAASICMNVEGWLFTFPLGFCAAISVRVSNELGAWNPRAAKFSVWVMVSMSVIVQTTFALLIFITRNDFPAIFTDDKLVMAKSSTIVPFLCVSILLCSVQPVLSGVAIGAGWQATVAYVNITCYYAIGLPIGTLLGFRFNFGLEGLWTGVLLGMSLQTIILLIITLRTDWEKEATVANQRISNWGSSDADVQSTESKVLNFAEVQNPNNKNLN